MRQAAYRGFVQWLGSSRKEFSAARNAPTRRGGVRLEMLERRVLMSVFNVNSTADILNPQAGVVTLRSAIEAANNSPGNNTINLTVAGTYKITIPGAGEDNNQSGDFDIIPNTASPAGSTLVIKDTSGGSVVVDGNHLDRVFDINPGDANNPAQVTMQGFTITNGNAFDAVNPDSLNSSGGGIRDQGNTSLTLTDMVVTNNVASADGGGIVMANIVNSSWTLTVNHSTISNNHAGDAGGGIDTDGSGSVVINSGTVISGNTDVNQGAGVYVDAVQVGAVFVGASMNMTGTIVSNNAALAQGITSSGGGISNAGNGAITLTNCTVASNHSLGGTGGGFSDENNQGTLIVSNSLFVNNTSTSDGGGIQEGGPSTSITNTQIAGNSSGGNGGGLFVNGTTLTVSSTTFAGNTASGNGGGIEVQTTGTGSQGSTITNTTLTGNNALNNGGADGGGIDASTGFTGSLTLENDTISGNFASAGGGVFWTGSNGSGFAVENTILAGNSALTGPDANNPAGTFTDMGGNLIGVSGAGGGNTGFTATSTQPGTVANALEPLLGELKDNGGPVAGAKGDSITLQTMAPLSGSPAIGKGILVNAPPTDERGLPTVVNGMVNVGAVSAAVVDQPLTVRRVFPVLAIEGRAFSGRLVRFSDADKGALAADYSVTIDWGDGTTSVGTVARDPLGGFDVSGAHTYADEGTFVIKVTIDDTIGRHDSGGSSAVATTTAKVFDARLAAHGKTLTGMEGDLHTGTIATFTDGNAAAPASDFTATINWGDGQTSTGTISGSQGHYSVTGTHTYAEGGAFTPRTVITDDGGSSATVLGKALVSDAPLTGFPVTFTAVLGQSFSGVIGSFSDANLNAAAGDFTVKINWGQGPKSLGTVVFNSATHQFDIMGTHMYHGHATQRTVSISVSDTGGARVTSESTVMVT